MQKPLLVGLLALAACSKKDATPTPAPTPIPVPTGHWVTDGVYAGPRGGKLAPGALNNVQVYSSGQVDFSGTTLTVTPGLLVYSSTSPAATAYSLALPLLSYPAQAQGAGRVDSFVQVSATSFTWRRYGTTVTSMAYSSYVVYATFHR